jgi:hypothetical protein
MAAQLTDIQKKKIVVDYLECQSVNLTAKRNGVSWATTKKVLDGAGDIKEKLEQKKEENTADILAYMESRRQAVCDIIEVGLAVLPEKIQNARSAAEVTTALGTLIDKFTAFGGGPGNDAKEDGLSQSLRELAEGLESDEN